MQLVLDHRIVYGSTVEIAIEGYQRNVMGCVVSFVWTIISVYINGW